MANAASSSWRVQPPPSSVMHQPYGSAPAAARRLARRPLPQEGGDDLAVGLALGGLHGLTDEEAHHLLIAALEAVEFCGVVGDELVDHRGQRILVHGLEAELGGDRGGVAAPFEHLR